MKIEIIIHHISGETKRYPVHKLVRHGEIYTAHYTTVQAGFHVTKKVDIDNVNAEIEVKK